MSTVISEMNPCPDYRQLNAWRLGLVLVVALAVAGPMEPRFSVAAETGKLVEKDGQYVFVESMDPATRLLLERAVKQGTITQEEYLNVIAESERRTQLLQPSFRAWYDRGFNFSMNDNAFFLKIRGFVQGRFTQRFRNEAWRNPGDAKNYPELLGVFGDYRSQRSQNDASSFTMRRVRLMFMGHLLTPDLKYFVQLAGETAENAQNPGSVQLLDASILSTHLPLLNVMVGQYKVFFNRSEINNATSMQFAERSGVMDAFTASGLNRRDIGITLMNDEEIYPVNYYVGIFNGLGPGFNRFGSFTSEQATEDCPGGQTSGQPIGCPAEQRNLNANLRTSVSQLMYVARLNLNILGRPGYGEGDMAYSETPQMAVGGGFAYNPSINTATDNAFVGIDLANLNVRRQLATFGNGRQLGWGILDYSTYAFDGVFKYRGFSLQGEWFWKNINRHQKSLPCMQTVSATNATCTAFAQGLLGNATGWYVQSGYFLIPRKLQLAARYSWWDPDTNSGGDLIKQVDVAVSYYLSGTYDHQIQIQYTNLFMGTGGFAIGRSAPLPSGATALNSSGTVPLDAVQRNLIENAIRVQYSIFF
ncbi:MAG TPA: porin [Nitrospira sp.]|nr:porin [Nitrospira sp.]